MFIKFRIWKGRRFCHIGTIAAIASTFLGVISGCNSGKLQAELRSYCSTPFTGPVRIDYYGFPPYQKNELVRRVYILGHRERIIDMGQNMERTATGSYNQSLVGKTLYDSKGQPIEPIKSFLLSQSLFAGPGMPRIITSLSRSQGTFGGKRAITFIGTEKSRAWLPKIDQGPRRPGEPQILSTSKSDPGIPVTYSYDFKVWVSTKSHRPMSAEFSNFHGLPKGYYIGYSRINYDYKPFNASLLTIPWNEYIKVIKDVPIFSKKYADSYLSIISKLKFQKDHPIVTQIYKGIKLKLCSLVTDDDNAALIIVDANYEVPFGFKSGYHPVFIEGFPNPRLAYQHIKTYGRLGEELMPYQNGSHNFLVFSEAFRYNTVFSKKLTIKVPVYRSKKFLGYAVFSNVPTLHCSNCALINTYDHPVLWSMRYLGPYLPKPETISPTKGKS